MSHPMIEIEGLGKQYHRKGISAGGNLRDWFAEQIKGKKRDKNDLFWALKNLDLRVEQGEILGIVGRNGSGKSTFLKVLSRITPPTTGRAILRGKVASLLEVGTGFHPELTGRENIYLNGVILGMNRQEVSKHFDAIVEFAGVEDFIEAKVKHYSSGMYVRLAFSVAAHLRTDILLVDEVLAVGDAEFQQKSLGKMNEVVREKGRTILFVSHNLGIMRKLCTRMIGLDRGEVFHRGTVNDTLNAYFNLIDGSSRKDIQFTGPVKDRILALSIRLNELPVAEVKFVSLGEKLHFRCTLAHTIERPFKFHLALFREGVRLFTLQDVEQYSRAEKRVESHFTIQAGQLRPGRYTVAIGGLMDHDQGDWFWGENLATFEIQPDWQSSNDPINYGWLAPRATSHRINLPA